MVKKAQKNNKKKGEFFFNFNQLRRKLNSKQKEKLINFFGNFKVMFSTVKQHLFQVNKMYDLMEQEYKRFQKDLFKDDEFLSGPHQEDENNEKNQRGDEEFLLDEDIMKQILDEGLKDEKEKKKEPKENNTVKNIIDNYLLEKEDKNIVKVTENQNDAKKEGESEVEKK